MAADKALPTGVAALFTGSPSRAVINGTLETTAFARARRRGPVKIDADGLQGNALGTARKLGQENHAIYLLASAHYAAHEARLGRKIQPGGFGENVLYDGGLDETALRIGAWLQLGSARIQAVAPRIPCYKLAHFLQADQGFPAAFSASDKTGFYARVVTPGMVEEGAPLTLLEQNRENATLANLNHALTSPHLNLERVESVLASPDLLPELATMVRDRLISLRPELKYRPVNARIVARHHIAPDIAQIEIAPDAADMTNNWSWVAGQFVTLGQAGSMALRSYSLVDGPRPDSPATPFTIAVRRGHAPAEVSVSRWLEGTADRGTALSLYPPAGRFVLPEAPGPIVLIGGGIGMTAILALLRALAARKHAQPVTLLQVARNPQDLIFAKEIGTALKSLSCGRVQRYVTRTKAISPLQDDLPEPAFGRPNIPALLADCAEGAVVFVCGPPALVQDFEIAHRALGRPAAQFYSEVFEPLGASETDTFDDMPPAKVHIAGVGIVGEWTPDAGPLLTWIEGTLGRALPASCRAGLCRTCAARLRAGRVRYPRGITPPQDGTALLCCARPDGPVELDLS